MLCDRSWWFKAIWQSLASHQHLPASSSLSVLVCALWLGAVIHFQSLKEVVGPFPFCPLQPLHGPGSFPRGAAWPLLWRCLAYALGLISICEVWSVFSCLPQHHTLAHHHVLSSHAFQRLLLQPAVPHGSCQGKMMTCYYFLPTSTRELNLDKTLLWAGRTKKVL